MQTTERSFLLSHLLSYVYSNANLWMVLHMLIYCMHTNRYDRYFFPFYNMKKIKWRYFFYPIYIWFNNKLLVVWLIYLGHLKKDIDIPFSFFFFFLFCETCFDVALLSTILPFRAILLNIILTHAPLGLRVAQTYLNQYLYFLIWYWINIISNEDYLEWVKTNKSQDIQS